MGQEARTSSHFNKPQRSNSRPFAIYVIRPNSHTAGGHFEDATLQDGRPEHGEGCRDKKINTNLKCSSNSSDVPPRFVASGSVPVSSSQAAGSRRRRGGRHITVKGKEKFNREKDNIQEVVSFGQSTAPKSGTTAEKQSISKDRRRGCESLDK